MASSASPLSRGLGVDVVEHRVCGLRDVADHQRWFLLTCHMNMRCCTRYGANAITSRVTTSTPNLRNMTASRGVWCPAAHQQLKRDVGVSVWRRDNPMTAPTLGRIPSTSTGRVSGD